MNTVVWIFQGLLSLMFFAAGIRHLLITNGKIRERPDDIITDFSILFIKLLGLFEVLGAIGVILPWLFNIVPILTPVSAAGFGVIMITALILFFKHNVFRRAPYAIVILSMAVFVAIARLGLI